MWSEVVPYLRRMCMVLGYSLRVVDVRLTVPSEFAMMAQVRCSRWPCSQQVHARVGTNAGRAELFASGRRELARAHERYGER